MKPLRRLRVGQIVAVGFISVLLMASLIALLGRIAYDISTRQRDTIETRREVERLILRLELLSIRRTDALDHYLQSSNVQILATYQSHQSAYIDTFSRLTRLLNTPREEAALTDVETAGNAFEKKAEEVLRLNNQDFSASARFLWNSEGDNAQENLVVAINELRQAQNTTSRGVIAQAQETERLTVITISILVPLLLIAGLAAGFVITRTITKPIRGLVKAVNQIGADLKARVNPTGPQEIAFLGETINTMAASLSASKLALQTHKEQLERELVLAGRLQNNLLPHTLPNLPGIELATFRQSARELGGDFFTYTQLKDGQHSIAIGDASGKGAPAAMASAVAVGLLEAYAATHSTPEALLADLNNELHLRFHVDRMNIACCYIAIDETIRCLRVVNAGCIYPYIRRDQKLHEIEAYGMPLGMWPNFNYLPHSFALAVGDILLLSSDGLVEAKNRYDEMFGFERLEAELLNLPIKFSAQAVLDHLVESVMAFIGDTELHDDLTLVVLRVVEKSTHLAKRFDN